MTTRLGAMLGDVLQSLVRKPVTERYPFVRKEAPETLRGRVVWNAEKCTGCGLCVKDCPSRSLELITLDKANKRFVMLYHLDRCTYCAQCVETCRFDAIGMTSKQWELATLTKQPFAIYMGREEDIQAAENKTAAK